MHAWESQPPSRPCRHGSGGHWGWVSTVKKSAIWRKWEGEHSSPRSFTASSVWYALTIPHSTQYYFTRRWFTHPFLMFATDSLSYLLLMSCSFNQFFLCLIYFSDWYATDHWSALAHIAALHQVKLVRIYEHLLKRTPQKHEYGRIFHFMQCRCASCEIVEGVHLWSLPYDLLRATAK